MDLEKSIGLGADTSAAAQERNIRYINLKLAYLGCPTAGEEPSSEYDDMVAALLSRHQETDRLLSDYLCPADQRIQRFLEDYLQPDVTAARLPVHTFVLDRHGLARTLSLPPDKDLFESDIVSSYRVRQGVLHNPRSDRRTTQGIFHVVEGGSPVPADKFCVPKVVFGEMLRRALDPPADRLRLPFTSNQPDQAACFVSLLLRPIVCPEVPGVVTEKSMEVRFFAPGNLVSNLDFVESIFGNAGDPFLPVNDAGLDVEHWSGHTGCVILAPHLTRSTKRDVGLPHWDEASERQRREGMCWRSETELYNGGQAFKLTCRDDRGVIVTIIADNYFGYCKKEVKTQISYAANLLGYCEEEHAGGALVYPSYDLGEEYSGDLHAPRMGHSFREVAALYGERMKLRPEGYGIDRLYSDILYVPENTRFDLHRQAVSWTSEGEERTIKLLPGNTYVRPSGYRVQMMKPAGGRAWRLVGTMPEGTLCHKPCTVSGGGKSEISKPITDAILQGPVFVADFKRDFDRVAELIERDYSDRFRDPAMRSGRSRPVLSPERSLGSVIKLMTPASREYTDAYNAQLEAIPQHIKDLLFVVKRFYKPAWGPNWRDHFSVDIINGVPGNELKCDNRKLVSSYLRVGYDQNGAWRTFGLRKDFSPAVKWQFEDDITASVVVPAQALGGLNSGSSRRALKFVKNCEYRLFQRPDEAIHRGYDKQTEADFSQPGNFLSNYEPLRLEQARDLMEDAIGFDAYTEPMQRFIRSVAESGNKCYFVSTAHPRVIDGKPSKNPRYLQTRSDLLHPRESYLAEMATRLYRRLPLDQPVLFPVGAVLPGRRNNPADPGSGLRSLAVYNPIHYMELPEAFMEFICSMTGKSPSTTGAGSEGALTKGPFNAMPPILDLNNALVSYILTGHDIFITSAGYVGPHNRVDHDISLLVPEVWSRMSAAERDPQFLIKHGYLERCKDFEHEGRKVLTSRLGYRITRRFVKTFFGMIFSHPHTLFSEGMLRPEKQDLRQIVDGMDNIVETQRRVAALYFEDGSVELACPPLKALLHIMCYDQFEGKDLAHPDIRRAFTREALLASDWYRGELQRRQTREIALWERHVAYLEAFLDRASYAEVAKRMHIRERLEHAESMLAGVQSPDYLARAQAAFAD
jgi:phosphoenolpyruvate carboxykinase (diphosphate)